MDTLGLLSPDEVIRNRATLRCGLLSHELGNRALQGIAARLLRMLKKSGGINVWEEGVVRDGDPDDDFGLPSGWEGIAGGWGCPTAFVDKKLGTNKCICIFAIGLPDPKSRVSSVLFKEGSQGLVLRSKYSTSRMLPGKLDIVYTVSSETGTSQFRPGRADILYLATPVFYIPNEHMCIQLISESMVEKEEHVVLHSLVAKPLNQEKEV